jgi:hypothetical protein
MAQRGSPAMSAFAPLSGPQRTSTRPDPRHPDLSTRPSRRPVGYAAALYRPEGARHTSFLVGPNIDALTLGDAGAAWNVTAQGSMADGSARKWQVTPRPGVPGRAAAVFLDFDPTGATAAIRAVCR